MRLGFFVGVVPKKYRSQKALAAKRKHAEEGLTSAHPAWVLSSLLLLSALCFLI